MQFKSELVPHTYYHTSVIEECEPGRCLTFRVYLHERLFLLVEDIGDGCIDLEVLVEVITERAVEEPTPLVVDRVAGHPVTVRGQVLRAPVVGQPELLVVILVDTDQVGDVFG